MGIINTFPADSVLLYEESNISFKLVLIVRKRHSDIIDSVALIEYNRDSCAPRYGVNGRYLNVEKINVEIRACESPYLSAHVKTIIVSAAFLDRACTRRQGGGRSFLQLTHRA